MKVYDGASWITATSAGATSLIRFRYVATSGQTTFSGADAASATLTYTVNNIVVMRNGVTLDTSEYTASNGTSVVLGVAAGTGDIVDIVAFKSFTVADALSAVSGGTVNGAVTVTGALAASTLKATTTIGVGNATPSTSGAGITFPATQSASSDANTLDDYEEGTWTPTVVQSGATFTYSYQTARYTKVGNAVTIMATLGWSAKSGGSGAVGIAGLPFASINVATSYQQIVCGDFYGFTFPSSSYTNMTAEIVTNTTTGSFLATGSAVSGAVVSSIGSTGLVFLQCTYLTN